MLDFLTKYHAVIDCGQMALRLTAADHKLTSQTSDVKGDLSVTLPKTYNIPSRCVMLVTGSVQSQGRAIEGLVEQELNIHNTIMVARGLCCAQSNGAVVLQMVNIGPEAVTLYKGTRVAVFSPRNYIMVLSEEDGVKAGGGYTNSNGPVPVDLSKSNLSGEQKSRLLKLLEQFRELFVSDDHALGRTSMVTHKIKTTGPPIQQPLRRLPESLKAVVHKELESMQNKGVVRPSCSPWASPMVLIRKKDGKWRFCVDYRKLNSVTERDAFPLPRVDATLDSLAGSKLFTTLDLASGYWQVEVLEEDKSKTAFPTPYGLFEFNVMPFGLTNAPATFQRLMQCVLAGLSPEQCLTYIDDVIVFSASFEQHLTRLRAVLERIAKAGLRLKTAKCQFVQRQVKYLGHVVSEQGIEPDPQKTQAVKNFSIPTNATMVKQFLGLSNYYRRFIQNYAIVAEPLYKLTRKETGFQWSETCQDAFDTLKNKLISAPILVYPEFDKPFLLYTDASDNAIGGVLGQKHVDGEKVIAYWSRQLHKAERQYSTVEKEALAAVSAVKEFYPYLYGFPFTLITDHNPLVSLKGLKDIGGRLSRWIIFLQQFNMEFRYKPGKEHSNADCMSRYFPQDAPLISFASQLDLNDMESIKQAQAADAQLIELSKALKTSRPPKGLERLYRTAVMKEGVLYRKYRKTSKDEPILQLLVPTNMKLLVLRELHDQSGHLGITKTLDKVRSRFYWTGYEADIERHIQECVKCQQRKMPQPSCPAPLGTIEANYPFQKLSWDLMGPSKQYRYILVVSDIFTKWVEVFPLERTDSKTLASALVNEVICRYGVPSVLHSDQGSNFTSEVMKEVCSLLGIKRTQTSAYHPQGNGQTERFNRTLEAMLAKSVEEHQSDWSDYIPKLMMAYRTSVHETTKLSPFFLNFGRSPCLPIDVMMGRGEAHDGAGSRKVSDYTRQLRNTLKVAYDTVRSNVLRSKQKQKVNYEKDGISEEFSVGDRVWLFIPAVKTGRTKKLASLWRGPYMVIDRTGHVNYRIQLIGTTKTLIVHRNRLKLCYGEPGVQETRHKQTDSLNQALSTPDELGGPSIEIDSQPANDAILDEEPVDEVGGANRLEAEETEREEDDQIAQGVQSEEDNQDIVREEIEMEAEEDERGVDDQAAPEDEDYDNQDIVRNEIEDNSEEDEDSESMGAQEIVQNQRPQRIRRPPERYRDFVPS